MSSEVQLMKTTTLAETEDPLSQFLWQFGINRFPAVTGGRALSFLQMQILNNSKKEYTFLTLLLLEISFKVIFV